MNKRGTCWEGYVQKGMKKKGNKMVPNCVPGMKSGGLTKWFKEKWVDIGSKKKDGKYQECGRKSASSSKRKYPKCVPLAKATRMTKSQKASAVARKRAAPNTGPKPTNVRTAFMGGMIPVNPAQAISAAQQSAPQDYINYKMTGNIQPVDKVIQPVEPVKKQEVEEKNSGGLVYTKSVQQDYYKNLI
jgi:hypothetical protein